MFPVFKSLVVEKESLRGNECLINNRERILKQKWMGPRLGPSNYQSTFVSESVFEEVILLSIISALNLMEIAVSR